MTWVLIAAAAAMAYGYSIWRHPTRPCRRCGGSGLHRDKIWTRASGTCHACKGRGYHPRLGVRIFTKDTYRSIRAGKHGKNY